MLSAHLPKRDRLLIGTYTEPLGRIDGRATGLLSADYDTARGSMVEPVLAFAMRNPSWVAASGDGRRVYATSEIRSDNASAGGAVLAFAHNQSSSLELLSSVRCGGQPCHFVIAPSERFLVVANYGSGTVATIAIEDDGQLGPLAFIVQHESGNIDGAPRRARPHHICFDPATGDVLVADLGLDTVFCYAIGDDGRLTERTAARLVLAPGSGPRQTAFHPAGEHLFILHQNSSTLTCARRRGGTFQPVLEIPTMPEAYAGPNRAAAIRLSPSGCHVLVSNRGHNSLLITEFDYIRTSLGRAGWVAAGGAEPRDFCFSPTGANLHVANQDDHRISRFHVKDDGAYLLPAGATPVSSPACLCFIRFTD